MADDTQIETPQNDDVVLKISASKESGYTKRVAGAMGWQLQEKGMLRARAVKSQAVSTATKAVAICNQRVAAAGVVLYMELLFSPAENDQGKPSTAIEMVIQEVDSSRPTEFVDYRVSGQQQEDKNVAMKLAEAIAAPVRDGKGVTMRCIGPSAVYRAILASTIARGLVFPNGVDALVVPTWDSMIGDQDKQISLIKVDFWGRKVNG